MSPIGTWRQFVAAHQSVGFGAKLTLQRAALTVDPAASGADEARLDVGQANIVRPAVSADLDVMAAAVIAAIGFLAALAGDCHMRNVLWGYSNNSHFDRKEAVRLNHFARMRLQRRDLVRIHQRL